MLRSPSSPPPPLKTLPTHLGQRAGLLILARGLEGQTAVANGRVLRGGERPPPPPPHFGRRRPKRPAWKVGEGSPGSPEGRSGRSGDPRCQLQLTPLPLDIVRWEGCWRPRDLGSCGDGLFCWTPDGRWGAGPALPEGAGARRNGGRGVQGRRRRRHSPPPGKPLRSQGLVFELSLFPSPPSGLCCAGRGSGRPTLPPSVEPAGCWGGISLPPPPPPRKHICCTHLCDLLGLVRVCRKGIAIKKHWDGGEDGPGYR